MLIAQIPYAEPIVRDPVSLTIQRTMTMREGTYISTKSTELRYLDLVQHLHALLRERALAPFVPRLHSLTTGVPHLRAIVRAHGSVLSWEKREKRNHSLELTGELFGWYALVSELFYMLPNCQIRSERQD